ncbi:unnamed protein product [Dibothriocephalus latus]|uniref:Uncharacterized protein n=1 Tax=Dibothriocephalus latus TaxID=60516 RepID=A0A3P7LG90_DIBLA|nr:unnamed protein product [Dibothriocephalus latus]
MLDQGGLNDPFRAPLSNHQSPLPSLPPASAASVGSSSSRVAPKGMEGLIPPTSLTIGTRAVATRAKLSSAGISQSSNVNPPSAFDDQFSEDEEMDDLFSLATEGTTKPGKNP